MRVALYPRVSGHEQEDNYSIPEQIERMKKYCESRDWMVYKIYTDPGYSGSNMDRPGLQSLIKDVEAKKVDMVLVYKLDRLSRSQKDVLYLVEDVFDKNGVAFASMTESFQTDTPFGKAILGILAVFAQLERSTIRERTMMGKESRAREGKWHGSNCIPIGYDYKDDVLTVNEYEAMQVKMIMSLFLDRTPIKTIESIMREKGYRHRYGEWDTRTIRRTLKNPVYLGMIKHRDNIYPGLHDEIIDQKTFDAIQEITKERLDQYASVSRAHTTLLGGFLFCKHCGSRYAKQYNGYGRDYYTCYSRSKKVKHMIKDPNCKNKLHRADYLDKVILDEISKLAIDPNYMDTIRDSRPKYDLGKKIKSITAEIEKIDSQISKMMDLYSVGSIDLDVIASKVEELNKTKHALQFELDSLDVPEEEELTAKEVQELATMMNDETLSLADKRNIIQSLIDYIEIDEENILIHWKF